jgi:1-acyl-sn-glycerol-3-phosphate acyltransferase
MKMMSVLKKTVPTIINIQADGLANIPAEGPVLLVGDHPNIIDGIVLSVVSPRPVRILVAAELCTSPFVKRIIQNLGWLPVERHAEGKNGDTMRECVEALERGEVVAVFPEGKTNYGKGLLPFKSGAALIAHKSGAPVVPFSVRGTEELYPDGSKVFHRGRVAMTFGEPSEFEKTDERLKPEVVTSTLGEMKERILQLQGRLSKADVGRGLGKAFSLGGLAGAAAIKALSLALLTVKWR